ncbi:MAG: hypothetical protein CENE_01281 [Candidatus Celerinatantimonas neptuna]|nr:MAG: hypothetical protein CENE_01281 [Candidatus Celerinatantimonas neptuna]
MKTKSNVSLLLITLLATPLSYANFGHYLSITKPSVPPGVGFTESVPDPTLPNGEIAVVDGDIPVTNDKHNTLAYNPEDNPILQILKGFNQIWFAGNTTWASDGSANLKAVDGDTGIQGGATHSTSEAITFNFSQATIRNPLIWKENFDYVTTLTRENQCIANLFYRENVHLPPAWQAWFAKMIISSHMVQCAPDVDRTIAINQRKAYLDDQRNKAFSIISGLGGLASDYKKGANATSPYAIDKTTTTNVLITKDSETTSINVVSADKLYNKKLVSHGTGYGTSRSSLNDVVKLLNTIADYGASTEAPKYHFQSPRPWRVSKTNYRVPNFANANELEKRTCYNLDGTTSVSKFYETPTHPIVKPINGLLCAARAVYQKTEDNGKTSFSSGYDGSGSWISSRGKDGAFPSGHTAEAFDRGLGYAYAIPERFAEMVARAADLGEDRIVAGMHSPLDVIGGRIMATAITAATLNDPNNASIASDALTQAHDYFKAIANNAGYASIYDYAHRKGVQDDYKNHAAFKARYRAYLTYGFTQNIFLAGQKPVVPKGAQVLLKTRLPYLNEMQRRAVLATTEVDSGYPLLDKSHGWGRLNLVAAADGYGAFNGDVNIYMDGSKANINPFYGKDIWRNNISGVGRLLKDGSGSLTLTGHNTYLGGTLVKSGTLVAASRHAFGFGDLYQQNGTIEVNAAGALYVRNYTQDNGILKIDIGQDNHQLTVANIAYLDGGSLQLNFNQYQPDSGTTVMLLSARAIHGKFKHVRANQGYQVQLHYGRHQISATVTR